MERFLSQLDLNALIGQVWSGNITEKNLYSTLPQPTMENQDYLRHYRNDRKQNIRAAIMIPVLQRANQSLIDTFNSLPEGTFPQVEIDDHTFKSIDDFINIHSGNIEKDALYNYTQRLIKNHTQAILDTCYQKHPNLKDLHDKVHKNTDKLGAVGTGIEIITAAINTAEIYGIDPVEFIINSRNLIYKLAGESTSGKGNPNDLFEKGMINTEMFLLRQKFYEFFDTVITDKSDFIKNTSENIPADLENGAFYKGVLEELTCISDLSERRKTFTDIFVGQYKDITEAGLNDEKFVETLFRFLNAEEQDKLAKLIRDYEFSLILNPINTTNMVFNPKYFEVKSNSIDFRKSTSELYLDDKIYPAKTPLYFLVFAESGERLIDITPKSTTTMCLGLRASDPEIHWPQALDFGQGIVNSISVAEGIMLYIYTQARAKLKA